MADNNTLFFDLGLNTDRLKKDLINAREQIAKMQIKAELDIEIPDISIQGFQKKIEALNKQIADLTNKNKNSNAGWAASEVIKGEIANLNKEVARYQTFIDRLKHAGANVGGIDLSISGGEKVLDIIEKVSAELSKFEKGIDIKLNIGGGGEPDIEKLKTIEGEIAQYKQRIAEDDAKAAMYAEKIEKNNRKILSITKKIEDAKKNFSSKYGIEYSNGVSFGSNDADFKKAEAQITRLETRLKNLRYDTSVSEFGAGGTTKGNLDVFAESRDALIKKMEAAQAEYNAELAKGDGLMSNLQEELRQLANLDLTVDVNFQEAERKIQELKEEIGELRNVDIVITTANDETAIANLTRLKELVDKLNMPIEIKISGNTDISGMISESSNNTGGLMDKLKPKLDRMADDLFSDPNATGIDYVVNVRANETYLIASVKSILERNKFNVNLEGGNFQQEIEKDIREALKKLKDKGIELKTVADADKLIKSINSALRGQKFEIGVVVTKADATRAVKKALQEASDKYAGQATIDLTNKQALAAKREADARLANAKAMEREAAARLKNAKAAQTESGAINDVGEKLDNISNIVSGNLGYLDQFRDMIRDTFSLYGIKRFAEQVITIGGEFEKQKIALKSILGDAIQAEVIYSQIKNLAVKSPFEFKDLTSYAKQLSAFSIPYNELFDTTKRLADISAGLGVDMGRIILAYGQVRSAAVLRGQELRQFTEAGIPLVSELAKRFTELEGEVVSTGEVFDRISKRMVSFEMVQDILFDMTEEGGKFFEMQEELAESLSGKWSNLKDAYNIMLSEIAEGNNGVLKGTVELITRMLNNWEKWGAVLGGAATTFAIYKGILAAVNVQQALNIISTQGLTNAQIANNAAYTKGASTLVKSLKGIKTWWAALGSLGHWGLAVAAIAGVGVAVYNLTKKTDAFKKSLEEASNEMSGKLTSDMADFKRLVNELGKSIEGTREHSRILNDIKSKYGSFVGDIDNVSNAYEYLRGKVEDVTAAMREQMKQNFITKTSTESTNKFNEVYNDEYDSLVERLQEKDIRRSGVAMSRTDALKVANELFNKAFQLIDKGYSSGSLVFESAMNDIADQHEIDFGLSKTWYKAFGDIADAADAWAKNKREIKEITTMAEAVFGVPDTPDPLKGWRKSVADFISSLEGTDEEIYKVLFPQTPKNDEKTLKDWAKGILNMYDESVKDMELYRKQKETAPELLDEEMMKKEEIRIAAFKKIRDKFNLEMFREEKGGGGASDDLVADMWEKRIELLEKAQTLYKKWVDVEGHKAALKRVQGDETFGSIFSDKNLADILTDPDKVWRYIQSQLGGTEKQKELSTELDLKISERSYENVKKDADRFIEQLKNSLKRSAERWDIYNDLIKAGFDKNVSSSVAGGISFTSYVDELKRQLAAQLEGSGISIEDALLGKADLSKVKNASFIGYLVDEINNENKRLNSESAKNLAELVKNYRNYEQKIAEINRSLETDILTIRGSELSDEDKERMIEERRRVAKEDISKADFEEFKRTSDWVKVFDDLDRVSNDTLDSMIANIEKFIEGGVESEEVLKQIIEALRKLREEDIERNPFMASSKAAVRLADAYKARKLFKDNPYAEIYHGIQRGEEDNAIKAAKQDLENSFNEIGNKFKELSNVVGEVSKMMESFGNNSLTEFASILDSMASGFSSGTSAGKIFGGVGGMLGGVAGTIVGMFSGIYASAERATQKEIEASDARRAEMETYKGLLEKMISNSLTGLYSLGLYDSTRTKLEKMATDYENLRKTYGYDINDNDVKLRYEDDANFSWETDRRYAYSGATERYIQKALQQNNPYLAELAFLYAERDEYAVGHVNDKDFKAKMEEYNMQIEELTTSIMSDLYSINFEDWASRVADSIVSAWAAGEDAVGAYKDAVEDMLLDVAKSMVEQKIIGEYINENLDPLITEFIETGGVVDESFFGRLVEFIGGLENSVESSVAFMEELEKTANKAGLSWKGNSDSSGSLSGVIKNVTEDTAQLIASYLNAIRQDVSIKRAEIIKLVNDLFPQHFVLCQAQLQQLNMIQQNTKITADKITEMNSNFNAVLNGTKKVSVK